MTTTNATEMTNTIINMTPHAVDLVELHTDDVTGNENVVLIHKFPPSGGTIRLSQQTVKKGELCIHEGFDVPITQTVFSEPVGLPEYQKGVFYIVSQLVKNALPNRTDLLVPAEVVRDKEGKIIGCLSFGI